MESSSALVVSRLTFFQNARILHWQDVKPARIISTMNKRKRHLIVFKQANYPYIKSRVGSWIRKNDAAVRVSPVLLGGASFLLVLLNRTFSGIAPVADASSAQSRADVIALVLATTAVLNGLVWISVKPKKLLSVELSGVQCLRVDESLSGGASAELIWTWKALREATCCQALVVVYRSQCVLQAGVMAESQGVAKYVDCPSLVKGSLCQNVWASGKQSYLANLALFPGRFELGFLPPNTQAVILQPLGDEGILIVAGDTIRGFGPTDQAWILSIGEKLDATLGKSESTMLSHTSVSNISL